MPWSKFSTCPARSFSDTALSFVQTHGWFASGQIENLPHVNTTLCRCGRNSDRLLMAGVYVFFCVLVKRAWSKRQAEGSV